VRAFQSETVSMTDAVQRGNLVGMRFQIPLQSLTPGQYICQLNVIDELGKKFAFRRTPLVLLP
jgi:hypothetical protein